MFFYDSFVVYLMVFVFYMGFVVNDVGYYVGLLYGGVINFLGFIFYGLMGYVFFVLNLFNWVRRIEVFKL